MRQDRHAISVPVTTVNRSTQRPVKNGRKRRSAIWKIRRFASRGSGVRVSLAPPNRFLYLARSEALKIGSALVAIMTASGRVGGIWEIIFCLPTGQHQRL